MKTKQSYPILILVFFLIWTLSILLGYYLYHKPLSPQTASAAVGSVWNLLVGLWIISLCGSLGRHIQRWLGFSADQNLVVPAALGMGVFSLIVLLFGFFSFQFKILLWLLFLIPVPFVWRQAIAFWKRILVELRSFTHERGISRWFLFMIGIILVLSLLTALSPPIHYDALTYHLALPRQYLEANGISQQVDWLRSGMPQTGEMIQTWSLSVGNDAIPAVTGWLFAVITLIGLISFLRGMLSTQAGLVGGLILLGGSSIAAATGWGYIDWYCLMFGLASLISLHGYIGSNELKYVRLAGLFSGFAFATKYTAGILFAGLLVWLVLLINRGKIKIASALWALLVGFAIPALPWLVKNWIFTGNPLAPFGVPIIGEQNIHQQMMRIAEPFGNWLDILFLPIRATILGVEGGVGYSHDIGPLLLIFTGLCWLPNDLQKGERGFFRACLVIAFTSLAVWILGNQMDALLVQSRLYYVVFPVFTVLAAAGYQAVADLNIASVRLSRIANTVIILVAVLVIFSQWNQVEGSSTLAYLSGNIDRNEYLTRNLGWYQTAVNEIKSTQARTVFLYEPRPYTCLPFCSPDEILDRWHNIVLEKGDCDAIFTGWKNEGYDQLLINTAGVEFFKTANDPHHSIADLEGLSTCLKSLPEDKSFGEAYRLYRLR